MRARSHDRERAYFYGCSAYDERGRSVCTTGADVPMLDAHGVVIEALLTMSSTTQ